MGNVIAKLLRDFENGHMSRRQLIQSLALAAAAASTASAASGPAAQASGFKAVSVDHISYQVIDYAHRRSETAWLTPTRKRHVAKAGQPTAWLSPRTFQLHSGVSDYECCKPEGPRLFSPAAADLFSTVAERVLVNRRTKLNSRESCDWH